jgi:hypothetical protein
MHRGLTKTNLLTTLYVQESVRSSKPTVYEDEGEIYESMEEIWPDYPDEDYLWNEDEY